MSPNPEATTRFLLPAILLLAASQTLGGQEPSATPAASPEEPQLEAAGREVSADLQRRIDYETAQLALTTGNRLIGLLLLERLAATTGDTPEGRFYEAVTANALGQMTRAESLALAALEALETLAEAKPAAPDRAPWFLGELTRLAARPELARLSVQSRRGVAEILAKHYEARGGLDKLEAIQSMIITGTLEVGESSLEFRVYRLRPAFYRFEMATAEGFAVEATDSRVVWRRDPTVGEGRVRFLDRREGARLRRDAPFDDVLVRFGRSQTEVHLVGRVHRDSREVYRLEVLAKDGNRQTVYLDTATFLEINRELYDSAGEVSLEVRTEYAEHGGVLLPSVLTVTSAQGLNRYRFTAYDFETPVDRWLFDAESLEKPHQ